MSIEIHGRKILTGESRDIGENLSQFHIVHHKSHMD
jgi:hypothetical protein